MKNKEQFDNSIKVLVKAYLSDTLRHANCMVCAVGNLVCAGMGYDMIPAVKGWELPSGQLRYYADWPYEGSGEQEINSTGYTREDIVLIEEAFESKNGDQDGYKGLCAVFDVLVKIHQGSDKELELAKEQLVKA